MAGQHSQQAEDGALASSETTTYDEQETQQLLAFGKTYLAGFPARFALRSTTITKACCGDTHTVLVADNGKVFGFGDNAWGQLGIGGRSKVTAPTIISSLASFSIVDAACGRSHTLLATADGALLAFGANGEHQLGVEVEEKTCVPHELVSLGRRQYKALACGADHNACLTSDGRLYMWGCNSSGQLGFGSGKEVETPKQLKLKHKSKLVTVACGYYHTALLYRDGTLWTFGEGEHGKLGHGSEADVKSPRQVQTLSKVRGIACGANHTLAYAVSGTYAFGDNSRGQLGLGMGNKDKTKCLEPARVEAISGKPVAVACGEAHSVVLHKDGTVWSMGAARHGRLGDDNPEAKPTSSQDSLASEDQFEPKPIWLPSGYKATCVAAGGCHSVVVTQPAGQDNLTQTEDQELGLSSDDDIPLSDSDDQHEQASQQPSSLANTLNLDTAKPVGFSLTSRARSKRRQTTHDSAAKLWKQAQETQANQEHDRAASAGGDAAGEASNHQKGDKKAVEGSSQKEQPASDSDDDADPEEDVADQLDESALLRALEADQDSSGNGTAESSSEQTPQSSAEAVGTSKAEQDPKAEKSGVHDDSGQLVQQTDASLESQHQVQPEEGAAENNETASSKTLQQEEHSDAGREAPSDDKSTGKRQRQRNREARQGRSKACTIS